MLGERRLSQQLSASGEDQLLRAQQTSISSFYASINHSDVHPISWLFSLVLEVKTWQQQWFAGVRLSFPAGVNDPVLLFFDVPYPNIHCQLVTTMVGTRSQTTADHTLKCKNWVLKPLDRSGALWRTSWNSLQTHLTTLNLVFMIKQLSCIYLQFYKLTPSEISWIRYEGMQFGCTDIRFTLVLKKTLKREVMSTEVRF